MDQDFLLSGQNSPEMNIFLVAAFLVWANALLIPDLTRNITTAVLGIEALKSYPIEKEKTPIYEETGQLSKYIVVFKSGHDDTDYKAHQSWVNGKCANLEKRGGILEAFKARFWKSKFTSLQYFKLENLSGYTAFLPKALVDVIEKSPVVDFIEKDGHAHIHDVMVQDFATWGLERISHRKLDRNLYLGRYSYDHSAGSGVTAYVIDSGVNGKDSEFEGRVKETLKFSFTTTSQDMNGHGTHVAGTIGGKTFGIAKNVDLVSLKVFGALGLGFKSSIIMAIEHVIHQHKARIESRDPTYKGAVINMLLGSLPSDAIDKSVRAAYHAGIVVVTSAGNENQDACNLSPSRSPYAITAAATDYDDDFASFSNYGACVDMLAPGVAIQSVTIKRKKSVLSGTSMAAPHVSGVVALLLSLQPPLNSEFSTGSLVSPGEIKRRLTKFATQGAITKVPAGTPNRLVYNGGEEDISDFWSR